LEKLGVKDIPEELISKKNGYSQYSIYDKNF